jgi:hypothetical protein
VFSYPSERVSILCAKGRNKLSHPAVIVMNMNDQLVLLDDDETDRFAYRRLDEHTREVGRRGVASAREALRRAAPASAPARAA